MLQTCHASIVILLVLLGNYPCQMVRKNYFDLSSGGKNISRNTRCYPDASMAIEEMKLMLFLKW